MIVKANQTIKDFLTKGKDYPVLGECGDGYLIMNDKGNEEYFDKYRFDTLTEPIKK